MRLKFSNDMKPKFVTLMLLVILFLNLAFLGTLGSRRFEFTSQIKKFEKNLMSILEAHFITGVDQNN